VVESLRLRQVLQELARTYEMVIVDAPPLLAVSDALSLTRASRGTVLVVEFERTTRRMLSDARARLEAGGVEPIGAVLNKVEEGRTGGYYRQYARLYTQPPAAPRAPGKSEQAS
jgi:Mrp family chromosome partitioning ATPase